MADSVFASAENNPYYALSDVLRQDLLKKTILPYLENAFLAWPNFRSAMLLVAQFWNDAADDAVHALVIFSELETPDFEASVVAEESEQPDLVNWPSQPEQIALEGYSRPEVPGISETLWEWDENGQAITAFACFCQEGSQYQSARDSFLPYAVFRRGDPIQTEITGKKLRPWLEGIEPQWEHGDRLLLGVEMWNGKAWKWLKEGTELCWEAMYHPSPILIDLLLGRQGLPVLSSHIGLPQNLSQQARQIFRRLEAPPAHDHIKKNQRWMSIQDLCGYSGWETLLTLPVELNRWDFKKWLQTPESFSSLGSWADQPDPDWELIPSRALRRAAVGQHFLIPWPQLKEMLEQDSLREDLNYTTRLFFKKSISEHCHIFKNIVLPRLLELSGQQTQNFRLMCQVMPKS